MMSERKQLENCHLHLILRHLKVDPGTMYYKLDGLVTFVYTCIFNWLDAQIRITIRNIEE